MDKRKKSRSRGGLNGLPHAPVFHVRVLTILLCLLSLTKPEYPTRIRVLPPLSAAEGSERKRVAPFVSRMVLRDEGTLFLSHSRSS
jgi:hypothetical protein